jgi:hypothetical protein
MRCGGSCGVKLASGSTVGAGPAGAGAHDTLAAVAAVATGVEGSNEMIDVSTSALATIHR